MWNEFSFSLSVFIVQSNNLVDFIDNVYMVSLSRYFTFRRHIDCRLFNMFIEWIDLLKILDSELDERACRSKAEVLIRVTFRPIWVSWCHSFRKFNTFVDFTTTKMFLKISCNWMKCRIYRSHIHISYYLIELNFFSQYRPFSEGNNGKLLVTEILFSPCDSTIAINKIFFS